MLFIRDVFKSDTKILKTKIKKFHQINMKQTFQK